MKIILPESIQDITLHQFQLYNELLEREDLDEYQFNKRKIQIFTGLERNRIDLISVSDYNDIVTQIDLALNQTVEFTTTFFIKDVEFGFIPNLDKMTQGEFIDVSNYGTDVKELHKLMAVLFRPIKNKDSFGNYSIINYKGTEQYANIMKHMPLSIVNGSLVFFSSLANELVSYTQKYMVVEQAKVGAHPTTLKSGDGMQQLKNWLKARFGKLTPS
jgi:hypoxanthine-guanine phosphoribosyltransferase